MVKFYYNKTAASLRILFKSLEAGSMLDVIIGIAGHKKSEIPHVTNTRWSDPLYPTYIMLDCLLHATGDEKHFLLPEN